MEENRKEIHYRLGDESEIYTNIDQSGLNMKSRRIYCQYCKFYIESNLAGAQCKKCNSNMINFPKYRNEFMVG